MRSPIASNVFLGIDFRGKEFTLMAPAVVTVCVSGMITQPEIVILRTIPGFYLLDIHDG